MRGDSRMRILALRGGKSVASVETVAGFEVCVASETLVMATSLPPPPPRTQSQFAK